MGAQTENYAYLQTTKHPKHLHLLFDNKNQIEYLQFCYEEDF